jgi:hypothetical protein
VALVQALQKHGGGGGDANASSESIQSLPEPAESEYSVIPGSRKTSAEPLSLNRIGSIPFFFFFFFFLFVFSSS